MDGSKVSEEDQNLDQYSSIEAYLAYMARNIDPALAKFRDKDYASKQEAAGVGNSDKLNQEDRNKENENKNADAKQSTESETSSEKETKQTGTSAKDGATKKDDSEVIYSRGDDCQKEIEEWFRKARQWGLDNGFPDIDMKETTGAERSKTS